MDFALDRGGKGVPTGSIDNRVFIKTVNGVSERSQQRGNLKDDGYIAAILIHQITSMLCLG
jgi:hypothetical protein